MVTFNLVHMHHITEHRSDHHGFFFSWHTRMLKYFDANENAYGHTQGTVHSITRAQQSCHNVSRAEQQDHFLEKKQNKKQTNEQKKHS